MNHGKVTDASSNPGEVRLQSLDAYRGLVMVALASGGLGLARTAEHFQGCPLWQGLAYQVNHVDWVGCAFWDLIQPSFMFLVGASMAYSYTKRRSRGDSYGSMLRHAMVRSLVLILLGIFLISNGKESTSFSFVNVLTQIGLGYTFLFLLWGRAARTQFITAMAILVAYWGLFAVYPLPVGGAESGPLSGFEAHWNRNTNAATAFDVWLHQLTPAFEPFIYNAAGYQTLNFVPSLATMIFGLMAGELLRSDGRASQKFWLLVAAGVAGLVWGHDLNQVGVCPLVKKIWTPSWTLFSTGWTLLILAAFYGAIDLAKCRRWAFPLIVVGMNSIAMYVMTMTIMPWTRGTLKTHLGEGYVLVLGSAYAPIVEAASVMFVLWLFCYWLYRQKVFLRI